MSSRNALIVSVSVVMMVSATIMLTRESAEREPTRTAEPFVATLTDSIGRVSRIELHRGEESVELVRAIGDENAWTVASAGGYPARIEAVRDIVAGLRSLEVDEPLTAKRDRHAELGLAWPDASGNAMLVRILDAGNAPLHEIVLGEERWEPRSQYVRRLAEDQTYRCRGAVTAEATVRTFVDPAIVVIDQQEMRSIAHDGLVLTRDEASAESPIPSWKAELAGPVADGVWPEEQRAAAIQTLPSWAARLDLDDVRRRDREGASWTSDPALTVTYFLSNATVTVEGMREGEALWVRVSAAVSDPAAAAPFDWSAWNTRMSAWEFRLPEWKATSLARIRETKPTAAPASAPAPVSAPVSAPSGG
jgi:hypothetical protein